MSRGYLREPRQVTASWSAMARQRDKGKTVTASSKVSNRKEDKETGRGCLGDKGKTVTASSKVSDRKEGKETGRGCLGNKKIGQRCLGDKGREAC